MTTRELLGLAEDDGVAVALTDDLRLKVIGLDDTVAEWLPRLAEQRGWIIAALKPEDPTPEHRCHVCQRPARFGFEVNTRQDKEGRWACRDHRAEVGRVTSP